VLNTNVRSNKKVFSFYEYLCMVALNVGNCVRVCHNVVFLILLNECVGLMVTKFN